jgi:hypothetical protein
MAKTGKYSFTPHGSVADAVNDAAKPGRKAGNDLVDTIAELAKQARASAKLSSTHLHKLVDILIKTECREDMEIERTLDLLMECMELGYGKKDFEKLLGYYKGVSQPGYQFYKDDYDKKKREWK